MRVLAAEREKGDSRMRTCEGKCRYRNEGFRGHRHRWGTWGPGPDPVVDARTCCRCWKVEYRDSETKKPVASMRQTVGYRRLAERLQEAIVREKPKRARG